MTTMIVDDDSFFLKLLTRQLENLGVTEVTSFERANDALNALAKPNQPVDLVICDLQMPELDGIEMVRRMAALNYQGPVVLVSGEDDRIVQTAVLLARALKLHVLGSLRKPVSNEALQELLDRIAVDAAAAPLITRRDRKIYSADEVRSAISEGQIICVYQPKVRASNGEVVGVEALARWLHPRDGMIYPDQFIAVAEQGGLSKDLTIAVLDTALHQARHWLDLGLPLCIAVNASMHGLTALKFPDLVALKLAALRVPPELLTLEITESQAIENRSLTLDVLARLRLKRIGLSIDDFGTGNSSMAQLRDLPFNELKIDQGFVRGAATTPSRRAIYNASLDLAVELGIASVAEGVEDEEDWNFVRRTRCDLIQGYFVARPMLGEEIPSWVEAWKHRFAELTATGATAAE